MRTRRGNYIGASIHPYPPAVPPDPFPTGRGTFPFPTERGGPLKTVGYGFSPSFQEGVDCEQREQDGVIILVHQFTLTPRRFRRTPSQREGEPKKQWRGKRPAITFFCNKPGFIGHHSADSTNQTTPSVPSGPI